jgi:hypothetical protein
MIAFASPSPLSAQSVDVAMTEAPAMFTRVANSYFGGSLGFDGTRIAIGSKGRIDIYRWTGTAVVYEATLDPGAEPVTEFGWGGLDILGDRVIATDPQAADDRAAVYTFLRSSSGTWTRQARTLDSASFSGIVSPSVEIEDGRALMGAPYIGLGRAILLRADASGNFSWTPGRYSTWEPPFGNLSGFDVSVRGELIVLGNLGGRGPTEPGAAHLLRDTGTSIVEVRTIDNPTPNAHDQFGISTEIDDTQFFVSARYDDAAGFDAGAIHIYDHEGNLLQSLLGAGAYARMGAAFDVDGDWMIAGSPAFIPPGVTTESPHLGQVTFLQRGADGMWRPRGTVSSPGGTLGTGFGVTVQLEGRVAIVTANTAMVGAGTGRVWALRFSEPDGQSCATDDECTNGFCTDGVCCDTACEGTCEACSAARTGAANGVCAPVTSGTDPDDECADSTCSPSSCSARACVAPMACDGGTFDAGVDASAIDGGGLDGARLDGGALDAGRSDGGGLDASMGDASPDAGPSVPRVSLSCTCRAGAASSPGGPITLLLSLLAALIFRRR